jgi:NADPH2:quinone reductase
MNERESEGELMMKAVAVTRFGGPEVLELVDVPVPEPGPDQVLIKVAYAGVNYADLMARRGTYHARPVPFVPGYEVSGTITALGEGVTGLHVGQPVAALTVHDGYALFAVAQAALTFALDGVEGKVDLQQAAAFPAVAITAYDLLTRAGRLQPGESVLIHAASGGIGTAAGQIARALGARLVLGTTSSQQKAEVARPFGYDQVFLLDGFVGATLAATNGKGVDIVLDARGEPTRSQSLGVLAPFGRLVVFGNASDHPEQPISPTQLWTTNKAVVGYSITTLTQTAPNLVAETAQRVVYLLASSALTLMIDEVLPLAQAAEAHRRIEARTHVGKLLLQVS